MKCVNCIGVTALLVLAASLALPGSALGQAVPLPSTVGKVANTPVSIPMINMGDQKVAIYKIGPGEKEDLYTESVGTKKVPYILGVRETRMFKANITDEFVARAGEGNALLQHFRVDKSTTWLVVGNSKKMFALPVPLFGQQGEMWCWAASTEMVARYLGKEVPQCHQVANAMQRTPVECCLNPLPVLNEETGHEWGAITYKGASYALIEANFAKYNISYKRAANTLTSGDLKYALTGAEDLFRKRKFKGGPVYFGWWWQGGGGHIMVVTGYRYLGAGAEEKMWVYINDPWPPNIDKTKGGIRKLIPYEDWVSIAGQHTHGNDYYHDPEIKK